MLDPFVSHNRRKTDVKLMSGSGGKAEVGESKLLWALLQSLRDVDVVSAGWRRRRLRRYGRPGCFKSVNLG